MSEITLHFSPPTIYNVDQWIIGEAPTATGSLSAVASGTDVGTYPDYVNNLTYASGTYTYYYSVRFRTDDGDYTSWSDRMKGKEGAGLGYFILRPSGSNTIYLIPPPSGASNPSWLSNNGEYTVKIKSSGLYGENTTWLEEDYEFAFTTTICPLWSTVEAVRLRVGPILEGLPDDTINRMIYKASLEAIDRFLSEQNNYGCNWTDIPEELFRWVTCTAGILALNAALISGSAGGNTTKKLGGMSVTYDGGDIDSGQTRKDLMECARNAQQVLMAKLETGVQYAVKSKNNTFITHPQKSSTWGRQPNYWLNNGNRNGPWRDSHEYGEYRRNV